MKPSRLLAPLLACLLAISPLSLSAVPHQHRSGNDRVSFGNTITIPEGESNGDIVCFFCTVKVQGNVSGDLVTFFGNTEIAPERQISGDAVIFGGKLSLAENSSMGGSLVLFGGDLSQAASAVIHSDRVVFQGGGWLLVLLLPLLVPIGIIWLIIHLVRRRSYQFPAYPGGRRF